MSELAFCINYNYPLTYHFCSTPELLNNDSFVLRVYLAKQVVPVIRKVTVMSWIGLLCRCLLSLAQVLRY